MYEGTGWKRQFCLECHIKNVKRYFKKQRKIAARKIQKKKKQRGVDFYFNWVGGEKKSVSEK